jgi:hypothetical protein
MSQGSRTALLARIGAALLLPAALAAGCAARQRVPLDPACTPKEVTLYVDGEALDEVPRELVLSRDRPHKLYFKGPGYRPQLVILDPQELEDGRTGFAPGELCVELVPVALDRRLEVGVEEEVPTPPASNGSP